MKVKSTSPRKAHAMTLIKEAFGADKITNVEYHADANTYTANAFKHLGNRKYQKLETTAVDAGSFTVPVEVEETTNA